MGRRLRFPRFSLVLVSKVHDGTLVQLHSLRFDSASISPTYITTFQFGFDLSKGHDGTPISVKNEALLVLKSKVLHGNLLKFQF